MDLLFTRYADPFSFMDQAIMCGRFHEVIMDIINIKNEETEDDSLWEYYLHHPFIEISFEEFKRRLGIDIKKPSAQNLEATVHNSAQILNGFVPDMEA